MSLLERLLDEFDNDNEEDVPVEYHDEQRQASDADDLDRWKLLRKRTPDERTRDVLENLKKMMVVRRGYTLDGNGELDQEGFMYAQRGCVMAYVFPTQEELERRAAKAAALAEASVPKKKTTKKKKKKGEEDNEMETIDQPLMKIWEPRLNMAFLKQLFQNRLNSSTSAVSRVILVFRGYSVDSKVYGKIQEINLSEGQVEERLFSGWRGVIEVFSERAFFRDIMEHSLMPRMIDPAYDPGSAESQGLDPLNPPMVIGYRRATDDEIAEIMAQEGGGSYETLLHRLPLYQEDSVTRLYGWSPGTIIYCRGRVGLPSNSFYLVVESLVQ